MRMEKLDRKAAKAAKKAQKASDKYYKFTGFAPEQGSSAPEHATGGNMVHKQTEEAQQSPHYNKKQNTAYYLIRKGDTLYSIARKHGLSVAEIQRLNPGIKANELKIGTRLKLK